MNKRIIELAFRIASTPEFQELNKIAHEAILAGKANPFTPVPVTSNGWWQSIYDIKNGLAVLLDHRSCDFPGLDFTPSKLGDTLKELGVELGLTTAEEPKKEDPKRPSKQTKSKRPSKQTKSQYLYNECCDYLQDKYGYLERDYCGRWAVHPKSTEYTKPSEKRPYKDFWHWVIENYDITKSGETIMFTDDKIPEIEEGWIRTIYQRYMDEFGEDGKLEMLCEW